MQHKQSVEVTWINASFEHKGTARERGRLSRTMEKGDKKKEGKTKAVNKETELEG